MAGLIIELIETVEQQNSLYEQLLELSAKKKTVIIDNSLEKLQKLLDEESSLIGKCQRLDKQREQLFDDIAFVLNLKREDVTLSKLSAAIKGQPEEKRLTTAKDKAVSLLNKIKGINDVNRYLVEQSLEHIEFNVNLIRSAAGNESYYMDSSGNDIVLPGKVFFDTTQ